MSSTHERGVLSSNAICWLTSLFGMLKTPNYDLTVSFVEDRTYKLLIVDSIMNLFRGSVAF
jgi:hypothetical protein